MEKLSVENLEKAFYPVKQIVPLIKVIHDRIAVEVMRGCPNRCRFCQASIINRPVRIRKPKEVRRLCVETYRNTGFDMIALLSLSSVNYPFLEELVKGLGEDLGGLGVGVSIPSLRRDEAFYNLPEMISGIKKTGLTFAPESASDRTRTEIGKEVDMGVLCKSAEIAFRHGWKKLKLYYMAGFPAEGEEEVSRISETAREISLLRGRARQAAEIRVSVNPFVPKPHTPFQWLPMKNLQELIKIKLLIEAGSSRSLTIEFNEPRRALLEGAMTRGDRRMGEVIRRAWEKGAKMDSWEEFFSYRLWEESFRECGFELEACATKFFPLEGNLPWQHVSTGVDPETLKEELLKSGYAGYASPRDY